MVSGTHLWRLPTGQTPPKSHFGVSKLPFGCYPAAHGFWLLWFATGLSQPHASIKQNCPSVPVKFVLQPNHKKKTLSLFKGNARLGYISSPYP